MPVRTCTLMVVALLLCRPAAAESLVERGAYLVDGIAACGNCHSPQKPDGSPAGPPLSGGPPFDQPAFHAYPPNITPDRATGIGLWSEDDVVTALREGRTPAGAFLRPPMPVAFYRALSDRDAHAIAAYLRSLTPISNRVPASLYFHSVAAGHGGAVGHVPDPGRREPVAYGHYLAQLGHCMECHTPRDAEGRPESADRTGAGGLVLRGIFGAVVSANITQDRQGGIGAWTDAQIGDALRKGIRPDGSRLASIMPWRYFANMRDDDLDALIAYLRTVKPVGSEPG